MKLSDLLRLILSNLRRMKIRVAMTAIGVIIGTSAVVVLVSLGVGLQKQVTSSLYQIGSLDELTVRAQGGRPMEDNGNQNNKDNPILDAKTLEKIQELEGVIAVIPMLDVQLQGSLKLDKIEGWASVYGVDMETFTQFVKLERGSLDIYRGQVIVGASVSQNFIDWEMYDYENMDFSDMPEGPDMLEKMLQVTKYSYNETTFEAAETIVARLEVIGVLKGQGYTYDYGIFMPMKEAQRLNQRLNDGTPQPNPDKKGYPQVIVKLANPDYSSSVELALKEMKFNVESSRQALQQINQVFLIIQAVLGGIGAVALLVAAFGIANTMVMAIYERTREIGLMKAIGATNQNVMVIFLAEAGGIGFLGGVGGVLFSQGLIIVINLVARTLLPGDLLGMGGGNQEPTNLAAMPLWLPIFAVSFAVLVGVASGIYPAIRAAALSPIRALKYE